MSSRFFCPVPMSVGATIRLPETIAHHAMRVLRLRDGDAIVLFDGRGGEYLARLQPAGREVSATIEAHDPVERETLLRTTLVQALPSGDKMDWIVEKAVELGVAAIVPLIAERSVVRLSGERAEKRRAHLQAVAQAACEQCGRNRVPDVRPIEPLLAWLARIGDVPGQRIVLSPGGAQTLDDFGAPDDVILMVGPEGGWSQPELQSIRVAGFAPLALGPRILRTETAGLSALAAMQARWGDLGRAACRP